MNHIKIEMNKVETVFALLINSIDLVFTII